MLQNVKLLIQKSVLAVVHVLFIVMLEKIQERLWHGQKINNKM